MEKYEKEFNETLGFEVKQAKKMKVPVKHLCGTCLLEFPTCSGKEIVWGIDKYPDAKGIDTDIVLKCDTYKEAIIIHKDFDETLEFEAQQSKKIKGTEFKPTKTTIQETYILTLKDIDFIFRKQFNLNPEDSIKIHSGETVSGEVFSIEIERNK